jgi:hypothetical protein
MAFNVTVPRRGGDRVASVCGRGRGGASWFLARRAWRLERSHAVAHIGVHGGGCLPDSMKGMNPLGQTRPQGRNGLGHWQVR